MLQTTLNTNVPSFGKFQTEDISVSRDGNGNITQATMEVRVSGGADLKASSNLRHTLGNPNPSQSGTFTLKATGLGDEFKLQGKDGNRGQYVDINETKALDFIRSLVNSEDLFINTVQISDNEWGHTDLDEAVKSTFKKALKRR